MIIGNWIGIFSKAIPLLIFVHSAIASAAPTSFDCDVPPNHFSTVSEDLTGSPMISGMVKAEELRSGDNLPVAGARLVSPDGTHIVGFQLVAASAKSKQFDIILNTKRNDLIQQENFGQVAVIESIRFNLSVSNTGKVTLLIGVKSFNAEYVPILESNAMVFCSTAQFKFSEVVFSNTDSTGR